MIIMVEIRFITCGDPHIYSGSSNVTKLQNVVTFANDAFSKGKLDFIAFVGDIADTVSDGPSKSQQAANIISGLNPGIIKYLVAGNHDVIGSQCIQTCLSTTFPIVDKSCVFKTVHGIYPEQFYTFQKEGTQPQQNAVSQPQQNAVFNIIIPGICAASWSVNPTWYFNYNNPNINKSLPTLVFNHGPIFGNWDSFDGYATGMSTALSQFTNLVGIYAGHVHRDTNVMNGKTRNVTNNAIGSTSNVGYTRVKDDNTTDYTTLNYTQSFTDPFPDPSTKYRCTGNPDYQCVVDPAGPYNSLAECQAACQETPTKYRCTGAPNYQCVVDPVGPYNSLQECQNACKAPQPTQECNTNGCTLTRGNYLLNNNKWGASGATQSIFTNGTTGSVGFAWNNSASGYNYPEIIAGTARNCGTNTWSVFPIQYSNLNTCSTEIKYKFTQKPTVNSWWNLGFDIYWQNNTTQCDQGKVYNIMIWIHGKPNFAGTLIKDNISDGYNTWSYYRSDKNWPWDGFILKDRSKIPYEPVLNQEYTIKINIKALMNAINRTVSPSWYIAGIELGTENSGSLGATSGRIEISTYNLEVNGQTIGIGGTPTQTLTSISPASATVPVNGVRQFTALDQNNNPITSGITWSNTGVGSINSSGLYSAGTSAGTATVHAVQGSIDKTAPVTVTDIPTKKFNVFDVILDNAANKRGVIVMQDDLGTFTKDQACIEVCDRLGQI